MLKIILLIKLLIFNFSYANSYNINEKLKDNFIIQCLNNIFINLSSYTYNISHPIADPVSYISYNSSLK